MKPLTPLLTAAMLSVFSLNACGQSEERKMSIQEQTEQRFRLNPNPKEAYRIRIKINDAPGPFHYISEMDMDYVARNCSYLITSEFIGAAAHPRKAIQNLIKQVGEYEYETVFHADAMKDEDYFGEGLCRWKPEGFGFGVKATGKAEETDFAFGFLIQNLLEQKTLTKYYQKRGYPYYRNNDGSPIENHDIPDFGENSIQDYGSELQKDLFSITLTIEEL